MKRLVVLKHEDARWSFDDQGPKLVLEMKPYAQTERVDPFPCYAHDVKVVKDQIQEIESMVRMKFMPRWFVLPFESTSRTNGWANGNSYHTGKGNKYLPHPYIVLSGKRIPLHPAMTRYLVAHEYGHIVQVNLQHIMGLNWDEFCKMYAKDVRKIPYQGRYGGQMWHLNTGEIIANDVRLALLRKEEEFWPHEVPHTYQVPRVMKWWQAQLPVLDARNVTE